MRIAIFGATSQIAKDLVWSFFEHSQHETVLFARRTEVLKEWLVEVGIKQQYQVAGFDDFNQTQHFDAIINFVGVGNPARAVAMGAAIFDVTSHYDDLALNYVRQHPQCHYLFLSSGAAYGAKFDAPVDLSSTANISINNLQPHDWYGVAKLYAECRHRALAPLPIVDIRVFNYISPTLDINANFLITDILRAIRDKTLLKTSPDFIVRDYIHSSDFYRLVHAILAAPPANVAVDTYSKAPIDKPALLSAMQEKFGLQYELVPNGAGVNATGVKPHYYSRNTKAAEFGYTPTLTSLEGILLGY